MTKPLLAALLLATVASSASANVVATDRIEQPPSTRRVEGRLGLLLGGSDVGDADGFSVGVSAGAGYRIGDVTLRALFDHYRVGDGSDESNIRRGRGTRVGGAIRYSFVNSNDPDRERGGLGVDFWGEVGIGLEHVAWRRGGVFDRPSGEIAVGFELDGQGERNQGGRRRHGGYFMAFRTLIGQGPEMDGPAVCAGPCTKATRPSRTDLSMFFELGLHWGR
jgi:opacity protein-like surface antigen